MNTEFENIFNGQKIFAKVRWVTKFINAKINGTNSVIHRNIWAGFKYIALYYNDAIQKGIFLGFRTKLFPH